MESYNTSSFNNYCSYWLTCLPVDSVISSSSHKSVLFLVVLERSSVETEGTLPIDCTLMIKSVKDLLKIKKYLVSVSETTYLYLGFQVPFIA